MTQYLALMSAARLGHKRAGYLGIFTGANRGTSFAVVQHWLCNHGGGARYNICLTRTLYPSALPPW